MLAITPQMRILVAVEAVSPASLWTYHIGVCDTDVVILQESQCLQLN